MAGSFGATASGAGQGALKGASIGAMTAPVTGPFGAIAGAAIGGLVGGISAHKKYKNAHEFDQKNKDLLNADLNAMKRGELGLTEAEKRQAIANAMTAAGQQAGAAQRNIARDSLSASGTRDVAQYAKAQRDIGGNVAKAGAAASAGADQMSKQIAEARRAEILGRLQQQQATDLGQYNHDQSLAIESNKQEIAQIAAISSDFEKAMEDAGYWKSGGREDGPPPPAPATLPPGAV